MATKQRRSGNRATGRKRGGGRAKSATRRRSSPRARSGAREARPEQAPRLVEVRSEPARSDGNGATHAAAEVTPLWGAGVPGFARQAAGSVQSVARSAAAETARLADETGAELRRRREEAERERERAYRSDGEEELPGLSAIGIEIALGALRLVRTILTAPLRIGLAFLRPREA